MVENFQLLNTRLWLDGKPVHNWVTISFLISHSLCILILSSDFNWIFINLWVRRAHGEAWSNYWGLWEGSLEDTTKRMIGHGNQQFIWFYSWPRLSYLLQQGGHLMFIYIIYTIGSSPIKRERRRNNEAIWYLYLQDSSVRRICR